MGKLCNVYGDWSVEELDKRIAELSTLHSRPVFYKAKSEIDSQGRNIVGQLELGESMSNSIFIRYDKPSKAPEDVRGKLETAERIFPSGEDIRVRDILRVNGIYFVESKITPENQFMENYCREICGTIEHNGITYRFFNNQKEADALIKMKESHDPSFVDEVEKRIEEDLRKREIDLNDH